MMRAGIGGLDDGVNGACSLPVAFMLPASGLIAESRRGRKTLWPLPREFDWRQFRTHSLCSPMGAPSSRRYSSTLG